MTWKRGHDVDLLDEEHHRIYGSKWALGLDQVVYLKRLGLSPHHSVLDLGCGAGRAGIHFIRYLDKQNYVGIDGHEASINAFINYELKLHLLEDKLPKIQCTDFSRTPLTIANNYDYVIAFSVFNHLKNHDHAMRYIEQQLNSDGFFVTTFGIPDNVTEYGFELINEEITEALLVPNKKIHWYTYKKNS